VAHEEKNDYKDILFGYLHTPWWGRHGKSDGGFSVDVYRDGRVIHRTYLFYQVVRTEAEYKISKDSVIAIEALLKECQTAIDALDERPFNWSFGGSGSFFIFNGKQIITWSIRYYDEAELKKNNPSYYEEFRSVVRQENAILLLFSMITKILKRDGVNLSLYEVDFQQP